MRFLLDTHVWLWWTHGDGAHIAEDVRREIESPASFVFVSIASLWEISIKCALKKLAFPPNPGTYARRQLERQRFKLLEIRTAHIDEVAVLPAHHRDPFDRMIVAQARAEALTVVTADLSFASYDVSRLFV